MDFIYDRQQSDVDYIETLKEKLATGTATPQEKADWSSTRLKGAYDYTDLNRVGNNLKSLRDLGNEHGMSIVFPAEPKVDWNEDDRPTSAQMSSYLTNVGLIATAYGISTTQLPQTMVGLTITGANAIEYVLYQASQTDIITRLVTDEGDYLVTENGAILTT